MFLCHPFGVVYVMFIFSIIMSSLRDYVRLMNNFKDEFVLTYGVTLL
jgi:hypothetical protein